MKYKVGDKTLLGEIGRVTKGTFEEPLYVIYLEGNANGRPIVLDEKDVDKIAVEFKTVNFRMTVYNDFLQDSERNEFVTKECAKKLALFIAEEAQRGGFIKEERKYDEMRGEVEIRSRLNVAFRKIEDRKINRISYEDGFAANLWNQFVQSKATENHKSDSNSKEAKE